MAKKNPKKDRKPARVCIFCEGAERSPISGEHVWSDWAGKYFDRGAHDSRTVHREIRRGKTQELAAPPMREDFHGHIVTMKLRVVCKKCNNVWMGRIEEDAKPTLTQLVEGRFAALSAKDQLAVARWVALKFMVTDQTAPEDVTFTQAERSAFWKDRTIPGGLRIWIFRCGQPGFRSMLVQHSLSFVRSPAPPVLPAGKNIKSFALGFAELFIFAAFAQDETFHSEPGIQFRMGGDYQIWPVAAGGHVWPPSHRLTREEAYLVAQTFDVIVRSPRVSWIDGP